MRAKLGQRQDELANKEDIISDIRSNGAV